MLSIENSHANMTQNRLVKGWGAVTLLLTDTFLEYQFGSLWGKIPQFETEMCGMRD